MRVQPVRVFGGNREPQVEFVNGLLSDSVESDVECFVLQDAKEIPRIDPEEDNVFVPATVRTVANVGRRKRD